MNRGLWILKTWKPGWGRGVDFRKLMWQALSAPRDSHLSEEELSDWTVVIRPVPGRGSHIKLQLITSNSFGNMCTPLLKSNILDLTVWGAGVPGINIIFKEAPWWFKHVSVKWDHCSQQAVYFRGIRYSLECYSSWRFLGSVQSSWMRALCVGSRNMHLFSSCSDSPHAHSSLRPTSLSIQVTRICLPETLRLKLKGTSGAPISQSLALCQLWK